ncbi:hypothetical protein AXG93_406s1410 [Marchantia polymorpha subsp. ruderalis]|uniref:Uncharacterized protein n=1 Tax=Marchantia polymorpha subsp. ruderalis TaxID=1480154 RepID=A0A176VCC9_MARPO|nr:hypothetical protein AXG93_406s1410 [Marchantia polymorpha subsp. ruderalis]
MTMGPSDEAMRYVNLISFTWRQGRSSQYINKLRAPDPSAAQHIAPEPSCLPHQSHSIPSFLVLACLRFFVLSTISRCLAAETLVAHAVLPASAPAATALRELRKDASAVTNAHATLATASENTAYLQTSDLHLADDG